MTFWRSTRRQRTTPSTARSGPVSTIWAVLFALVWVVSPVDVIPDIIPGFGWVDDAFVIALVFRAIRKDLRRYCRVKGLEPKTFGV